MPFWSRRSAASAVERIGPGGRRLRIEPLEDRCLLSVVYVDDDATAGAHDGSSWADAYVSLQDALAAVADETEIRVAQGVYRPDRGAGVTLRDRHATFQLLDAVALYGGYAGLGAPQPNARNVGLYETILSGDLRGDDGPNSNRGENSFHVVTGSGTGATAVLDGLTITAGYANGTTPDCQGAGMYNYRASPTITDCTFIDNRGRSCASAGGGMFNRESSPTVTGCSFVGNEADVWGGGGMFNLDFSNPLVLDCTFLDNQAPYGGAVGNRNSAPTLVNCTFARNSAIYGGGAIDSIDSNPTLTNCLLVGNSAAGMGGAVRVFEFSDVTLTNCTLVDNYAAGRGNALACDSNSQLEPSRLRIANSVLRNGGNEIYNVDGSSITVSYSCLQDAAPGDGNVFPGKGNIDGDPLLADPDGPDGNPATWQDNDYRLLAGSPCVDAANLSALPPDTADLDGDGDTDESTPWDLDGGTRAVDLPAVADTGNGSPPVDMGAYEMPWAGVEGRWIFYNNSAFDGGDPAAGAADDDAVAVDKAALLPGQAATFANYTSFSRGLNGVMVDLAAPLGAPTGEDFDFKIGNDDHPAGWVDAPRPDEIAFRPAAGAAGTDRVTITWADGAVSNCWLRVTVLAGGNSGLAQDDVFYFGNAIGESGNSAAEAKVNAYDVLAARNNQRNFLDPAPVDFDFDYNRDARVTAVDMLIARDNSTHFLNSLQLISVPQEPGGAAAASTLLAARGTFDWIGELEPDEPLKRRPVAAASRPPPPGESPRRVI